MSEEEEKVEEPDKSMKYLVYTIVFIVLLIVLFFSIKYFYNPKPIIETYKTANGQEFAHLAGLWNTQWEAGGNSYNLHFHYNPGQTENITIIGDFNDTAFNKGYVYITFDPKENETDLGYIRLATLELSLNIFRALNVEPRAACIKNDSACADIPIMNCTGTKEPVIQLSTKGSTAIGLKDNCIFVQGEKEELTRAADRVLFQWFGFI